MYQIDKLTNNGNLKKSLTESTSLNPDETIFFDIETAKLNETLKKDNDTSNLNMKTLSLTMFTYLIPDTKYFKKVIKKFENDFGINKPLKNTDSYETFEYHTTTSTLNKTLSYYTYTCYCEDGEIALDKLGEIQVKYLLGRSTTKISGYNSYKFDSLIFSKRKRDYDFIIEPQNKTIKVLPKDALIYFVNQDYSNENKSMNYTYNHYVDLMELANKFSNGKALGGLDSLGKTVGLEKLADKERFETIEDYKKYNVRDVEILYFFLDELVNDIGLTEANLNKYARNTFIKFLFESYEKQEVERIVTSHYINNFNFYSARTEAYVHNPFLMTDKVKYVDFNSLYTSARLVLDMAIPTVKKSKKVIKVDKLDSNKEPMFDKEGKKLRINKTTLISQINFDLIPTRDFVVESLKSDINELIYDLFDLYNENGGYIDYRYLHNFYNEYVSKSHFFMSKVKIKGLRKDIDHFALGYTKKEWEQVQQNILHIFPFKIKEEDFAAYRLKETEQEEADILFKEISERIDALEIKKVEYISIRKNKNETELNQQKRREKKYNDIVSRKFELKEDIKKFNTIGVKAKLKSLTNDTNVLCDYKETNTIYNLIQKYNDLISIYEVGFYEMIFLTFFDFELIDTYQILKGDDPAGHKIEEIFNLRKKAKANGEKKEKLFKQILVSSYGIFVTKNRLEQRITSTKEIDKIKNIENKHLETTGKNKVWDKNTIVTLEGKYKENIIEKKKINGTEAYYKTKPFFTQDKWSENSIPVIGFNIVSNGRFIMYSLMLNSIFQPKPNDSIYYTDTDSLVLNDELYRKLEKNGLLGEDIGQLKNEKMDYKTGKEDIITEATFMAGKAYIMKTDANDNYEISIKGTGGAFYNRYYAQNFTNGFKTIKREALKKGKLQKRTLVNNVFENFVGVSEELDNNVKELKTIHNKNYEKVYLQAELNNNKEDENGNKQ